MNREVLITDKNVKYMNKQQKHQQQKINIIIPIDKSKDNANKYRNIINGTNIRYELYTLIKASNSQRNQSIDLHS